MALFLLLSTFCATVLCISANSSGCPIYEITPVDLTYDCINGTEGSEGKSAVVLLHGMTSSRYDWNRVYETLALRTGRKVCRADLRNQGDSPWSNETSVAAMTVDVIHLLDSLGEQSGAIVGHSLGGIVAMHAALNYPERISGIVVEDVTPNMTNPEMRTYGLNFLKQLRDAMNLVPEGSNEADARPIFFHEFRDYMKQLNMSEEALNELHLPLTCAGGKCRWKANLDVIIDATENHFEHLFTPMCGVFNGSTLFLYGTNSEFKVLEAEDNIRELFPNVEFVGVEGAGHSIHGFFPQFEDEVTRFLNDTN